MILCMKTPQHLATVLIALALTPAFAQPQRTPPAAPQPQPAEPGSYGLVARETPKPPELTKFSLDFPGGTPRELVAAIQKAIGNPLNAIIPEEHTQVKLPPLKMSNVDVQQLFEALGAASIKREAYVTGTYYGPPGGPGQQWQIGQFGYGFRTQGRATDDSIWNFYVEKPPGPPLSPPKTCRFYPLAPYLERGFTVDDITTAIQTGWKMLGDKDTPTINYHQDTKLLIAVSEPSKLETIDAVLKALQPGPPGPEASFAERLQNIIQKASPPPATPPSPAKSPEKPKAEN